MAKRCMEKYPERACGKRYTRGISYKKCIERGCWPVFSLDLRLQFSCDKKVKNCGAGYKSVYNEYSCRMFF